MALPSRIRGDSIATAVSGLKASVVNDSADHASVYPSASARFTNSGKCSLVKASTGTVTPMFIMKKYVPKKSADYTDFADSKEQICVIGVIAAAGILNEV